MKNKIIKLFAFISLILFLNHNVVFATTKVHFSDLITQGDEFFQQGNFQSAVENWELSLPFLQNSGDEAQHIDVLIRLATVYQNLALHSKVFKTLDQAKNLVENTKNAAYKALVYSQLSDAWLSIGDITEAESFANKSVIYAEKANNAKIMARTLNTQGNVLFVFLEYSKAIQNYQQAIKLAKQINALELAARISINQLRAEIKASSLKRIIIVVNEVYKIVNSLDESYDKASHLIAIAIQSQALLQIKEVTEQLEYYETLKLLTYNAFLAAKEIAENLSNNRLLSLSYGYLGKLYQQQLDLNSALALTQKAIFFAKQERNPHILYRWYWQQGKIFKLQGKPELAIVAYRQASQILTSIQAVLEVGYRTLPGTFDEVVKPVHYGLADLLLEKADRIQDEFQRQKLLKEAISAVELVKIAELQDYFQDDCISSLKSKEVQLSTIAPKTAILYPIALKNRLVLITNISDKLYQKILPIPAKKLNKKATELRFYLQVRPNNRFLYAAKQLHEWLIEPIENILSKHQIDTLVIVPDGKLRLVPFSTLYDGNQFLVEKYAMALSPGLTLLNPQPINWNESKILLVGLSESVQGYSPLPNVPQELKNIQNLIQSTATTTQILNAEFSIENLYNHLQATEYSVIHLATHGEFNSDPNQTYLLAYEEKITMDKLQEIIGLGKFREKPLELLTLSACKTAVGDERAALGLAGIAIKAGARSALATLWFVDDEATSIAVTQFYQELLNNPGCSKAKALQNVQKSLIKQARYWHPSYWAPFLLIGNWL